MIYEIDGKEILTIDDFHDEFSKCEKVPDFYGRNFSAFNDTLKGLIETPFCLVWKNSSISKARLGKDFELLAKIMNDVAMGDIAHGFQDAFKYELM